MRQVRGFGLSELLVVMALTSIILMVGYRGLAGTWHAYRSQTSKVQARNASQVVLSKIKAQVRTSMKDAITEHEVAGETRMLVVRTYDGADSSGQPRWNSYLCLYLWEDGELKVSQLERDRLSAAGVQLRAEPAPFSAADLVALEGLAQEEGRAMCQNVEQFSVSDSWKTSSEALEVQLTVSYHTHGEKTMTQSTKAAFLSVNR